MFAVIFEVWPTSAGHEEYLKIAATLRDFLENQHGFISIERFQSLVEADKVLSLSFWQDESAIAAWRNLLEHRSAQHKGREELFQRYRIRVAEVMRDYSATQRDEAPVDSNTLLRWVDQPPLM